LGIKEQRRYWDAGKEINKGICQGGKSRKFCNVNGDCDGGEGLASGSNVQEAAK
jgi:hypothetical protein